MELLPRLGHEVVGRGRQSGRNLIERVRATKPDLVIADIKMPDMDGIEAAQAVNREMAVPVILVSGHHDDELVNRASSANVMTYLIKPVGEADLKTAIPLAMARFRQMPGLAAEFTTA